MEGVGHYCEDNDNDLLRRYNVLVEEETLETAASSSRTKRSLEADLTTAPRDVMAKAVGAEESESLEPFGNGSGRQKIPLQLPETPEEAEARLQEAAEKKAALEAKRAEPGNIIQSWLSHLPKDIDEALATSFQIEKQAKVPDCSKQEYKSKFVESIGELKLLRENMEEASAAKTYEQLDLHAARAKVKKLQNLKREWNDVINIYDPEGAAQKKLKAAKTTMRKT